MLGSLLFPLQASAQDAQKTRRAIRKVADAIVASATFGIIDSSTGSHYHSLAQVPADARLQLESPYNDWRYWNGVIDVAMLRLSDSLAEPAYRDFVAKSIAFCFDAYPSFQRRYTDQEKWAYPFAQLFTMEELDDCGSMGSAVIEVYQHERQERYRAYIDRAAAFVMNSIHRLDDSTFVRAFPHRWTLWADDLYMSVAFLSRMGELTGDARYFDEAARQVGNFQKRLFDERTGLLYHCWYSDIDQHGVALWGRANGWTLLAQVDLLDRLPRNHPKRNELLALLKRQLVGVARYQGPNGLWHQLLDKNDSFEETSCTAMITYAIAHSVRKGYLEPRYAAVAEQGWKGILTKIRDDGQIVGVCAGTGVSDDLVSYYHRPTPLNDPHGVGAVLMAGLEVLAFETEK